MKAAVYYETGGPEVFRYEDVPDPLCDASGVGIAAIQLAKRAGARVLATASSDAKLERLKAYGLDHGINYRASDFVGAVQDLTQGHGADLIVDSVGGRTLEGSIAAAAYRGR